jgi:hypothetical protein
MVSNERSYQKEYTCEKYESPSTNQSKVITKVNVLADRQTDRQSDRALAISRALIITTVHVLNTIYVHKVYFP